MRSGLASDLFTGLFDRHAAMCPMRRQEMVKGLSDTDDSGVQRNPFPVQAVGISRAVEPFMVIGDNLPNFRREPEGEDQSCSNFGVLLGSLAVI